MPDTQQLPVHEIVAGLKAMPETDFTDENVARYMRGRLADMDSLRPYIHFDRSLYTRNLIFKNEMFEALVLCWEAGQASPIHNHSGQHCWMSVQLGMLSVTNYRERSLSNGLPAKPGERRVVLEEVSRTERAGLGAVEHVDNLTYIHKIENLAAFDGRAISLHIYSRPFDACDIYDLEGQTARTIQLFYYTIDGNRVSLPDFGNRRTATTKTPS